MRGDWGGHCGSSRHHRRGFFISCVKIGLFFFQVCGDDAAKDFSEKELVDRWATAIQTKR